MGAPGQLARPCLGDATAVPVIMIVIMKRNCAYSAFSLHDQGEKASVADPAS